ncbi:hypothetical protein DFA_11220 [Cavenderia fasciculata]|uniref:Uncharacterized protein n=1 Tax=Cavenderia fasciculata TaxID=261658 RepID=F4QFK6_CACFS|nr:uncharacterized protein DFA_11220 [Cavenderia fasciculata]EGG13459.1 hypothetical protein DFA_11220 [Cavenderia fasciculata]|eukprot:XP_004350163.1 hypothetical protein DFA_11220 [Cavenderia fasciculata]
MQRALGGGARGGKGRRGNEGGGGLLQQSCLPNLKICKIDLAIIISVCQCLEYLSVCLSVWYMSVFDDIIINYGHYYGDDGGRVIVVDRFMCKSWNYYYYTNK